MVVLEVLVGATCRFTLLEILNLLLSYSPDPSASQSCSKWSSLECPVLGQPSVVSRLSLCSQPPWHCPAAAEISSANSHI